VANRYGQNQKETSVLATVMRVEERDRSFAVTYRPEGGPDRVEKGFFNDKSENSIARRLRPGTRVWITVSTFKSQSGTSLIGINSIKFYTEDDEAEMATGLQAQPRAVPGVEGSHLAEVGLLLRDACNNLKEIVGLLRKYTAEAKPDDQPSNPKRMSSWG
jgi:hypothetical protein